MFPFFFLQPSASLALSLLQKQGQEDLTYRSVEDLGLSLAAVNCLHSASIYTVGELMQHTEELFLIRNMGKKSLEEIVWELQRIGLSLRTPDESDS